MTISPGPGRYEAKDTVGGADLTFGLKPEPHPFKTPAPNEYSPDDHHHGPVYTMRPQTAFDPRQTRPGPADHNVDVSPVKPSTLPVRIHERISPLPTDTAETPGGHYLDD